MKVAFIYNGEVYNITQYNTLDEVPPHPPSDIYVEVDGNVEEGWEYDFNIGKAVQPLPQIDYIMPIETARDVISALSFCIKIPYLTESDAKVAILRSIRVAPSKYIKGFWKTNEFVDIGYTRIYGGIEYICKHACITEDYPNELWDIHKTINDNILEWDINETIAIDDIRTNCGIIYKCKVAHIAKEGWEPNKMPSLWDVI